MFPSRMLCAGAEARRKELGGCWFNRFVEFVLPGRVIVHFQWTTNWDLANYGEWYFLCALEIIFIARGEYTKNDEAIAT